MNEVKKGIAPAEPGHCEHECAERTLRIVYPSGYMELNLDTFFPCTVDRARRVFRLMRAYSPDEDKQRLLQHLIGQAQHFAVQAMCYSEMLSKAEGKGEKRHQLAERKRAQVLERRAWRNIQMLTKEVFV